MKLRKITTKKGQASSFSLFTFMIASFLAILVFAGMIWIMGKLNDVFTEIGVKDELRPRTTYTFPCLDNRSETCGGTFRANLTEASEQIWGKAYDSIQALRMVGIVYIMAYAICLVIIGFLERKYPFLFFVHVLITLLAVIFAPEISNAYESLLDQNIFDGELLNHPTSTYILLHLPVVVLIIGLLGGVGLFINLVRTGGEGEIR